MCQVKGCHVRRNMGIPIQASTCVHTYMYSQRHVHMHTHTHTYIYIHDRTRANRGAYTINTPRAIWPFRGSKSLKMSRRTAAGPHTAVWETLGNAAGLIRGCVSGTMSVPPTVRCRISASYITKLSAVSFRGTLLRVSGSRSRAVQGGEDVHRHEKVCGSPICRMLPQI
jgi:hypothetical protein